MNRAFYNHFVWRHVSFFLLKDHLPETAVRTYIVTMFHVSSSDIQKHAWAWFYKPCNLNLGTMLKVDP